MVEVKSKEKNREHAKNTRMRKKTYIESLKDDVKQLSDWREKTDNIRKLQVSMCMCVCMCVYMSYLEGAIPLGGRGMLDMTLSSLLQCSGLALSSIYPILSTMPCTPYTL